jgi:hypothetical protein
MARNCAGKKGITAARPKLWWGNVRIGAGVPCPGRETVNRRHRWSGSRESPPPLPGKLRIAAAGGGWGERCRCSGRHESPPPLLGRSAAAGREAPNRCPFVCYDAVQGMLILSICKPITVISLAGKKEKKRCAAK